MKRPVRTKSTEGALEGWFSRVACVHRVALDCLEQFQGLWCSPPASRALLDLMHRCMDRQHTHTHIILDFLNKKNKA